MREKAKMIQTERLVLKPYETDDVNDMLSLLYNDEIKETFMIPDFAGEEDAIKMFDRIKELSNLDEHFEYGIFLDNKLIGFINEVAIHDDVIEIGYVIHPDMKNKGFATEVLSEVIEELFKLGYTTIQAGLFEDNIASRRVMEKCGMYKIDKTDIIRYRNKEHRCIYLEKQRP